MKILFAEWESAGKNDLKEAFIAEGHELVCFPLGITAVQLFSEIENELLSALHKEKPDIVFSVNYLSAVSDICNKENIRYVSWTYDCPYREAYSSTIMNPCNIIYLFDKTLYLEFHNAGITTVHYMPMAANVERLDSMVDNSKLPFFYDISFVGSLYVEEGQDTYIDQVLPSLSVYTKGYLMGLMNSQLKIRGYDFIEELLSPVIDELWKILPIQMQPDGMETREYLYAQYVIGRRLTTLERLDLLEAVAGRHLVDLFTWGKDFTMSYVCNHGSVDYYTEMPWVFKKSKINLNISLWGIKSGIPLRAMDIMGCGGFLLSNFQRDFLDFFVPDEDFVFFENKEDLLRKIDYYLIHEDERKAIAKNGHDKVAAGHTYRHRVKEMLAPCEK